MDGWVFFELLYLDMVVMMMMMVLGVCEVWDGMGGLGWRDDLGKGSGDAVSIF